MSHPSDRLPCDCANRDKEHHRICNRGQNRCTPQTISSESGWSATTESSGPPRQNQRENIAEIVACVSDQRERPRPPPEKRFCPYKYQIEGDPDRECVSEGGRPVTVARAHLFSLNRSVMSVPGLKDSRRFGDNHSTTLINLF